MLPPLLLKTIPNAIDSAGSERQLAENLFYGWGYNAYKVENKLRADDQLVRNQISSWLGEARSEVARKEAEFRRDKLPPPTRQNPYPNKDALIYVRALQQIQRDIEAVEVEIRNAPSPANDRVQERHRNETSTLFSLMNADLALASEVLKMLRALSDPSFGVREISLDGIKSALRERQELLSVVFIL